MGKDLRWRIILIVVIVGACLYAIIPPKDKIRLGLDLKGGVQLVVRVNTDDALRLESETAAERLRDTVEKAGISGATINVTNPTTIQVAAVPPAQDGAFRQAAAEIEANFDRSSGLNGSYAFTMKPNFSRQLREDTVTQAHQTVDRRINELGVTEPTIAVQGVNKDELMIQLPGVTDVQRAKDLIGRTGTLELDLVESGPMPTREALLQAHSGQVPPNMKVLPGVESSAPGEPATTGYYLVTKVPVITGRDLRNAKPSIDSNSQPAVSFSLKSDGARKFGAATGANIGRQLAIVLDNRIESAPRIDGRITDEGQITGRFTQKEANDLSLVLRSGALPASLTYLQEETVGATLGVAFGSDFTASAPRTSIVSRFGFSCSVSQKLDPEFVSSTTCVTLAEGCAMRMRLISSALSPASAT
jgi:preprotein translocase subunit SecD